MRPTIRRLAAAAARTEEFLNANTPTGLTGLRTHSNPRQHLVFLYNQTLHKLSKFPNHSVYKQSTEALTKKRLEIITAAVPQGYEEWQARVKQQVEQNPQMFGPGGSATLREIGGTTYLLNRVKPVRDYREVEYDGEPIERRYEGPADEDEKDNQDLDFGKNIEDPTGYFNAEVALEPEPPLTTQQISEIEHKIGAGLIEEVIRVAEGEVQLIDTMYENQVWNDLEEKPPQGQWEYFERPTHMGTTK